MTTFEHGHWQAWEGVSTILLSDENTKKLRGFTTWDDVINYLFLDGSQDAARALNKQLKA